MKQCQNRIILLLLVVCLLAVSVGCGGYNSKAIIYYELPKPPLTLDPQLASEDAELLLVRNLFEGLLRRDENGEIVNGVITGYEYDNKVYTFHLSESVKWSDGTPLTADDFVFAFRRAVDPATKAPYANKLSKILNAEMILSGAVAAENLGVKAKDDVTLCITMAQHDNEFPAKLTTSVCMPCHRAFFETCEGQYGLSKDTIMTNGSYRLAKWNKEDFGIRLYRNDRYFGQFIPNNAGVFLSCNDNENNLELLSKSSVDIAYIPVSDLQKATAAGLMTAQTDNIVWVLQIGDGFSYDFRRSLILCINRSLYAGDLGIGFNIAYTLFPTSMAGQDLEHVGMPAYDAETSKALFDTAVSAMPDKKLPATTLIYYNDPAMAKPVGDIVGHWQSNLGAYLNIQPINSLAEIQNTIAKGGQFIAIYPLYITDSDPTAFVAQLGYDFSKTATINLASVQTQILSEYRIVPLALQNSVLAYSPDLKTFKYTIGNGMIDFCTIKKK